MDTNVKLLMTNLAGRLQRGEHVVLHGPRGGGKSAVLAALWTSLNDAGVPCGLAERTAALDDITRAFEVAYPAVDTASRSRRSARAHLRLAAEEHPGVLLLDCMTQVSTAMLGFMRRVRGGPLGMLMAVDVDTDCERERLRRWHLGTPKVAMPRAPSRRLRRLLRDCFAELDIPPLTPRDQRAILRSARGRPGWILQCARMARRSRYWHHGTLLTTVLCTDADIALRFGESTLPLADRCG